MAPKRKASQTADDAEKKRSAANLKLYLIECEREVELSEFDARLIDVVTESDYDSDDDDARDAMRKQREIIELAKEGKELGSWFAVDDEGDVLVFSNLDKANEYAQTIWIQMQYEDASDGGADADEDDHPEEFRDDSKSELASYSRDRIFTVDPAFVGARHEFVSFTKCSVVEAKHIK